MLDEKIINKNYALWLTKLQENDCNVDELTNKYGELIKNASLGMSSNSGTAYNGSMIHVVLRKICKYAININDMLPEELRIDKKKLLKVCLLQHISKAVMYKELEKENYRGDKYEFNDKLNAPLKSGERSALMCLQNGIILTDDEFDAMRVLDKDDDKSYYNSLLSSIVKSANIIAFAELKKK